MSGENINLSSFELKSDGGFLNINSTQKVDFFDFSMNSGNGSINITSPFVEIVNGSIRTMRGAIGITSQSSIIIGAEANLIATGNGSVSLVIPILSEAA